MFGRHEAWCRVALRFELCPTFFLAALALGATVLFWLRVVRLGAGLFLCTGTFCELTLNVYGWHAGL